MFRQFPALARRAGAGAASRANAAATSSTAVAKTADPWVEVTDEQTKQPYWWNKETNETTAVGVPKPAGLTAAPPPTQPAIGGRGGLLGAVADGLAFGVGSSMAHRMMDSALGPRQMEVVHTNEDTTGSSGSGTGDSGDSGGFFSGGGDDSGGGDGGGGWGGDW
eukprot:GEMP01046183.1.p2 GENE.GEMP01046183.1~~GEMP01046183.1.p2  ORF type:complete len:164 (+),score=49.21 GEMP01046183.1:71-562(+)